MLGYKFTKYIDRSKNQTPFERLLDIFLEMLVYTSGDVEEALDWLNELDKQYNFTNDDYTMDDFIQELKDKGYIGDDTGNGQGKMDPTGKTEQVIRQRSLDQVFGKMKRSTGGNHKTNFTGLGDDPSTERRPYNFGDRLEQISFTDSIRNAQINHGPNQFRLTENDLEIVENEHQSQASTVLMIDISHSMILYGEDRITPAKKVAMALSELIKRKYPKDSLDIVVFGNDSWEIKIKDLPYLKVGPYHTNTVAGLELAMDLLRRRKNHNKQIFMITDGKPSCIIENGEYYKNSFGLDPKIVNKTLNLAVQCRKLRIPITTFMIAQDSYLKKFVEDFTQANQGKAFYTGLKGLGDFIFEDYETNRRRNVR